MKLLDELPLGQTVMLPIYFCGPFGSPMTPSNSEAFLLKSRLMMATLTQECDISIICAGPAGLILSACLVRWGYAVKHIDIRAEPTQAG